MTLCLCFFLILVRWYGEERKRLNGDRKGKNKGRMAKKKGDNAYSLASFFNLGEVMARTRISVT